MERPVLTSRTRSSKFLFTDHEVILNQCNDHSGNDYENLHVWLKDRLDNMGMSGYDWKLTRVSQTPRPTLHASFLWSSSDCVSVASAPAG
jgi:hypothetical protein